MAAAEPLDKTMDADVVRLYIRQKIQASHLHGGSTRDYWQAGKSVHGIQAVEHVAQSSNASSTPQPLIRVWRGYVSV